MCFVEEVEDSTRRYYIPPQPVKAQPNKDIDTSAAHLFAYMFAEREYGLAMIETQRKLAEQNKVKAFSGKSRTISTTK